MVEIISQKEIEEFKQVELAILNKVKVRIEEFCESNNITWCNSMSERCFYIDGSSSYGYIMNRKGKVRISDEFECHSYDDRMLKLEIDLLFNEISRISFEMYNSETELIYML